MTANGLPAGLPILDSFQGVRKTGASQWQATCPAHEDATASLCIGVGDDGKTLLHCQAGCDLADVLQAAGKTPRDLFAAKATNGNGATRLGEIVASYDYQGIDAAPYLRVNRFEGKEFRQQRFADGEWQWKLNGLQSIPYHLPELRAADPATIIFVCEGEKDVDRLTALGLTAKTNPGGASKFAKIPAETLKAAFQGRRVVVLPDTDEPGRKHAKQVFDCLSGIAAEVKILELPGLPPKGDVSDWVDAGGSAAGLLKLARDTLQGSGTATPVEPKKYEPFEAANDPHRLARIALDAGRIAGELTLRYHRGEFSRYHKGAYQPIAREDVKAAIARDIKAEFDRLNTLKQLVDDGEAPPKPCEKVSASLVVNVELATASYCQSPSEIDQPSWIGDAPHNWAPNDMLATPGKLIHVPSLMKGDAPFSIPPTPLFFTRNSIGYDLADDSERAAPERWLDFLAELWPAAPDCIELLQEWFGYCLLPDTSQQKILLMVGPKRGGKGTIARILRETVGRNNVCGPTLGSLSTNFGTWPLIGKTLAVISDARLSGRVDAVVVTERLLAISGEDAITCDRKHLSPVTVRLPTRFMILTNELPRLTDSSGALVGRFLILRLLESWYGKEDHGLTDKLLAELPMILRWAIDGLKRLRERGRFVQPASGEEAMQQVEDIGSPVGAFVRDRCKTGVGCKIAVRDLFAAWKQWCEEQNREPGQDSIFARDLFSVVTSVKKIRLRAGAMRLYLYEGITLADAE